MGWIITLLQVLQYLPALITIIKEIYEAIEGEPIAMHQFKTMLEQHKPQPGMTATPEAQQAAIDDFTFFHTLHVSKPV